jgi:hypothetical protein
VAGWDRNANWNRDVLESIVALLFALAGLAELAAGAPCHRRRRVLAILSHGEAEARAFVLGISPEALSPTDATDSVGDAVCLAASFRALALALCALLARARQSALPCATGPRAGQCKPAGPVSHRAPPFAPDTS